MFILNEFLYNNPEALLMNAYQNKHEGSSPFKIGDFVCIVDIEIAKFRNVNVLDDYLPYERKLKTLFENANRIGEVTSIKRIRVKNKPTILVVKVNFSKNIFVEIRNVNFIKKVNQIGHF